MSAQSIGKRIATLRAARGITQWQLAERVGLSRSAVAQWESGYSSPSAGILVSVAKALKTSVDKILGAP